MRTAIKTQFRRITRALAALTAIIGIVLAMGLPEGNAATIGYWRFEGSDSSQSGANNDVFDDYSGNGHTLTGVGSPTQLSLPDTGPASDFHDPIPATKAVNNKVVGLDTSGGSDYFTAGDISTPDELTIEAYINVDDVTQSGPGKQVIAGHYGGSKSYMFYVESSKLVLLMENSSGVRDFPSASATELELTSGKDYFVAVTADIDDLTTNGVTFYLQDLTDGGDLLSQGVDRSNVTSLRDSNANFTIGNDDGNNHPLDGFIDEVRLSDAKLSEHQLLATIPEPTTLVLLGLGMVSLLGRRRRRG